MAFEFLRYPAVSCPLHPPISIDSLNTPLPDSTIATILNMLSREENFVFLETSKTTAEERRSLLFTKPVAQLSFHADQAPHAFFAKAQGYLDQGYFLAGWFAYEFGYALEPVLMHYLPALGNRPLARLGVYPPPLILDHAQPWPGTHPPLPLSAGPCPPLGSYQLTDLTLSLAEAEYQQRLARIKEYIVAGDTYQVNYTIKLLFAFAGSPEALYLDLRRNQPVSYGAYLNLDGERVLSCSPELFFRKQGLRCQVRPMKGTAGRGRTAAEDGRLAAALQADPKNRSENVMIVDLLRNDLGRISTMGGVEMTSLFQVESYATLHQMTSTITGHLPAATRIAPLFKALFPCGSVTGAPKIRTMEIIHELENGVRGVYTGAIGFIAPSGEATFNVPIRTIELNGSRGEMGIGSGIIHESGPEQEWRECLLKGRFLSDPAPAFCLIETLLWQPDSGYWLLREHLERLAASAAYFRYAFSQPELMARLDRLAMDFAASPMRVRLTLAKSGQIEISASPCAAPAAITWPMPQPAQSELPRVIFSPEATDPSSTWLFHKTTLRKLYDTERQQALAAGFYEVLFTNTRGEVTEGSITTIFVQQQGDLLTPPMECGLLPGVFRRYLLEHAPLPVREAILTRQDLARAEAIFVGNSVRGLVQVRLKC